MIVEFDENPAHRAFLYLDGALPEIHVPGSFLVTGDSERDDAHGEVVLALASELSQLLGTGWVILAEGRSAGGGGDIDRLRAAWDLFRDQLRARAEAADDG